MNNMDIFVPEALQAFFRGHPKPALAFSGGSDSAYLLAAAKACGADVALFHVHSCFQPDFELEDARRLADQFGCELHVLYADVLADENVCRNPADRCYFCKRRLFSAIIEAARRHGCDAVMDGTNASDDASDRPGMRVLQEMGVLSPLRSSGITKAQLREYSREAGLFTWNKPAYACLATRIPTGTPIEAEMLRRVEDGERTMMQMGFSDFRLRLNGRGARLEITREQLPLLLEKREELLAALEGDFSEITLDLRLRRE